MFDEVFADGRKAVDDDGLNVRVADGCLRRQAGPSLASVDLFSIISDIDCVIGKPGRLFADRGSRTGGLLSQSAMYGDGNCKARVVLPNQVVPTTTVKDKGNCVFIGFHKGIFLRRVPCLGFQVTSSATNWSEDDRALTATYPQTSDIDIFHIFRRTI